MTTMTKPQTTAQKRKSQKKLAKAREAGSPPVGPSVAPPTVGTSVPPGLAIGKGAPTPEPAPTAKVDVVAALQSQAERVKEPAAPVEEGPGEEAQAESDEALAGKGEPGPVVGAMTREEAEAQAAQEKAERWLSVTTLTDEDKAELAALWKLTGVDDPKFKGAMQGDKQYAFFAGLTDEQREFVSRNAIKNAKALAPDFVETARAARDKIAKEEAAKQAAELAEKQKKDLAAKKVADNQADWDKRKKDLRDRIALRVAAEIPGFDWEKGFDKDAASRSDKVRQGANAKGQASGLTSTWDANVDAEKKVRAVTEAASSLEFAKLDARVNRDLKDKVVKDPALTVDDFITEARAKLSEQRNPKDKDTWFRWMKLTKIYEDLPPKFGLDVHFTADNNALTIPPLVTEATTVADLLDGLFGHSSHWSYDAHVSVDTGVVDSKGDAKNPHLYWTNDKVVLTYEGGYVRWATEHTKAEMTKALKDSMATMKTRLETRAKAILDAGGAPKS